MRGRTWVLGWLVALGCALQLLASPMGCGAWSRDAVMAAGLAEPAAADEAVGEAEAVEAKESTKSATGSHQGDAAGAAGAKDPKKQAAKALQPGDDVELPLRPGYDLEFVFRWRMLSGAPSVDLDACAVCVGPDGQVVDGVSWKRRQACGGSVVHHGAASGEGKTLELNLQRLPSSGCCTVIICVFAPRGGNLEFVDSIVACVRAKAASSPERTTLCRVVVSGGGSSGVAIAALYSTTQGRSWRLKRMHVPLGGVTYQDSTDLIRKAALEADVVCSVPGDEFVVCKDKTFHMERGDKALITFTDVFLGLGWSCEEDLDLDSSVVLQNQEGGLQSAVFYNNKVYDTHIVHYGHCPASGEPSDSETIRLNLGTMPRNIAVLYVTVNIYSAGRSFREVKEPYVRLCEKDGHTLAMYSLGAALHSQGVVLCSLTRCAEQRWRMEALGTPCSGRTVLDPGTLEACGFRRVRMPRHRPRAARGPG